MKNYAAGKGYLANVKLIRASLADKAFEEHSFCMFTPVRNIALVLFALALSTLSTSASTLALAGTVEDANGRPIRGAQISIEGKEGSASGIVATTDAKGRYLCGGLGDGTFNVILTINGTVKASIANVRIWEGDPNQQLNFALTRGKATPHASGKHYVWVPSRPGSEVAGRWLEVDDRPGPKMNKATQGRIERAAGAEIQHIQGGVHQ